MALEPYQQRVVDELADLQKKRQRLGEFIRTAPEFGKLAPVEKKLLQEQLDETLKLENILEQRINIFHSKQEDRKPTDK